MVNKRLFSFLGVACLLAAASSAQAQGYFYGYYYPDEHRFSSNMLIEQASDYTTVTPMWNATHDTRSGYSYPRVPTNTPFPWQGAGYYYSPSGVASYNSSATSIAPWEPGFNAGPYPSWPRYYSGPPTSSAAPAPAAQKAGIYVTVPDANAVVWFGEYKTKSTGTQRVYETPVLQPGKHEYHVKVVYNQDGQQMVQERWVSVTPGRPITVDFNATVSEGVAYKNGTN